MTLSFKSLCRTGHYSCHLQPQLALRSDIRDYTRNFPKFTYPSAPTERAEALTLGVHRQCFWWPWVIRGPRKWLLTTQPTKELLHVLSCACVTATSFLSLFPCEFLRNSRSKPLLQSPSYLWCCTHAALTRIILLVPTFSILIKNRNELF